MEPTNAYFTYKEDDDHYAWLIVHAWQDGGIIYPVWFEMLIARPRKW